MANFMGTNFIWWMGIVENRSDPLKVGRVQCRAFAWDTSSKALLPTSQLLWAQTILPSNSNKVQPPTEGTMVFGFYMDGLDRQVPMVLGQLPGIPDSIGDPLTGFTDPRNLTQLQNSPSSPLSVDYNTDGLGAVIQDAANADRNPQILNEPTTSRLARNENIGSTIVSQKLNSTVTNVSIATGNALVDPPGDPLPTFSEPKTPYNATYPYNAVTQTESGHVIEVDDTPKAERIHIFHRTGTFMEMHPNGDMVTKVVGNNYDIIMADQNLNVMGNHNTSVNKNQTDLVQGDYLENINGSKTVFVLGDYNIVVKGTLNITSTGDTNLTVGGNYNVNVTGDVNLTSAVVNETIQGNINLDAALVKSTSDVTAGPISVEHHVHGNVVGGLDITDPPEG